MKAQNTKKTCRKKIGKYVVDLDDQLGSGSCAKVYRGSNIETNEPVAVKIIEKAQTQFDEYMKNAFFEQIKIMMKLKSPYIIGFLDVNETKSNFYVFLEIADQGTLRTILNDKKNRRERLTEKQTIKYLIQLLNGFGVMFKFGIIHRDIKPQNIFVKEGKLKIGDFGFAKNSQKLDQMLSTIVGSPAYMSPQILKKNKYSYKCDIWSLGIMTYEMFVGELPYDYKKLKFQGKYVEYPLLEIYKTVLSTNINYPSGINISPDMESFIKGCLQTNEEDRFDWFQLYNHPIFRGSFSQNFSNMKKGQQSLGYIMGEFRMIFNQYNVNIILELEKLKKSTLTIDQFKDFLQYLNCNIIQKDSQTLVEILKQKDQISLKDFQNLMEIHQCLPTDKHLSNESILIADRKKLSLVTNLINKKNTEKPIKLNELIPKEIMQKESLDLADFSKIIKSIIPQVPDYVLSQFKSIIFESEEGKKVAIPFFIQVMDYLLKQNE